MMERSEDSGQSTSLVQSPPTPGGPPVSSQVFDVAPEKAPHLRDYWNIILKRRWVVLSTLAIVYGVGGEALGEEPRSLQETLRAAKRSDGTPVFTPATCLSLLVFYVLAMHQKRSQLAHSAKPPASLRAILLGPERESRTRRVSP